MRKTCVYCGHPMEFDRPMHWSGNLFEDGKVWHDRCGKTFSKVLKAYSPRTATA